VPPPTRYARSGDVNLAFQVHGDGPVDVLFVTGLMSHVEHLWEEPGVVRMFDRFAAFSRLILMDRRGAGLSDPLSGELSLEDEIDDITAVLDAAGSERAALYGYTASGPFALHYAASRPERVRALVLYGAMAHAIRDDDMPWLPSIEERREWRAQLTAAWGTGSNLAVMAPSAADDERLRTWMGRMERLGASPGALQGLATNLERTDVRPLLASIRVPTLILHRTGDQMIDVRHSRYLAERIPGARYVELPGEDNLPFIGDTDALLDEIEEFLTSKRRAREPQRQLLTVLFSDICDGTKRAAELGDRRWRDLLATHDTEIRRQLDRHAGREVKTIGDGFLAVFGGPPSEAVRCAREIVQRTEQMDVPVRVGLHTGECEIIGEDIGGMAVHIAARVSALGGPGEVLASGTTFGTVVGAGFSWDDIGSRDLKGVPGRWPLFRLA
jgi:class 3 adenylate cyclase